MEDDENTTTRMEKVKLEDAADSGAHLESAARASTSTPKPRSSEAPSPTSLDGTKSQSDSVGTPNSTAKPARSSRKSSQKPTAREVPLYTHLPDVTDESCQTFQVIPDCLYGSKHLGSTDNDSLDCDCREEWRTSRPAGTPFLPISPLDFLDYYQHSSSLLAIFTDRKQEMARILPVAKIQTASIARPRWNVALMRETVVAVVKTGGFNVNNTPT